MCLSINTDKISSETTFQKEKDFVRDQLGMADFLGSNFQYGKTQRNIQFFTQMEAFLEERDYIIQYYFPMPKLSFF